MQVAGQGVCHLPGDSLAAELMDVFKTGGTVDIGVERWTKEWDLKGSTKARKRDGVRLWWMRVGDGSRE